MQDLGFNKFYPNDKSIEDLKTFLASYPEETIVSYLRNERRLPISLFKLDEVPANREVATKYLLSEGCSMRTEFDSIFLHPVYEIQKIIDNKSGCRIIVGSKVRAMYEEKNNVMSIVDNIDRGKYLLVEAKKIEEPHSFKDYLKTVDRNVLRKDYQKAYDSYCEKYLK